MFTSYVFFYTELKERINKKHEVFSAEGRGTERFLQPILGRLCAHVIVCTPHPESRGGGMTDSDFGTSRGGGGVRKF